MQGYAAEVKIWGEEGWAQIDSFNVITPTQGRGEEDRSGLGDLWERRDRPTKTADKVSADLSQGRWVSVIASGQAQEIKTFWPQGLETAQRSTWQLEVD